jgi:hypothetical protein
MRVLRTDVYVGGRRWFAGAVPPPEVAARIKNPKAWTEVPDRASGTPPTPAPAPETAVRQPVPEQPNTGSADLAAGDVVADEGDPAEAYVPAAPGEPTVAAPPRSGRGSGVEAWRAFASFCGVTVPADADRNDIIAACDAAGLLDE